MTGFLLALVLCLGVLLWRASRRSEPENYGYDSFPAPPPIPCSCPEETFTKLIMGEGGHVPPCAFAPTEKDIEVVCKNTPKGWRCKRARDHDGPCALEPINAPLRFLRRNENGKLERLVSDGNTAYWISAERPSRYWAVWKSIAKARGI